MLYLMFYAGVAHAARHHRRHDHRRAKPRLSARTHSIHNAADLVAQRQRERRARAHAVKTSLTLTGATAQAVEALPSIVEQTRALGGLVGFYTAPKGNPLGLSDPQRDRLIDQLLALREKAPEVVLNTEASLRLMRPRKAFELGMHCIYRHGAIAFDSSVKRKLPCTFGTQANCARCGCALMALQAAAASGDRASLSVMAALFPYA